MVDFTHSHISPEDRSRIDEVLGRMARSLPAFPIIDRDDYVQLGWVTVMRRGLAAASNGIIYTTARRKCIDELRKLRRNRHKADLKFVSIDQCPIQLDSDSDSRSLAESKDNSIELTRIFDEAEIPERDREFIVVMQEPSLSEDQIRLYSKNRVAAWSRKHRIMKRIRKSLQLI